VRRHLQICSKTKFLARQKFIKFLSVTKEFNSQGFDECKDSAKKGGNIAKRTREDMENTIGKSIISRKNHLKRIT
jgi:hypothetical protein